MYWTRFVAVAFHMAICIDLLPISHLSHLSLNVTYSGNLFTNICLVILVNINAYTSIIMQFYIYKNLYKEQSFGICQHMPAIIIWYRFGQRFYWPAYSGMPCANASILQTAASAKTMYRNETIIFHVPTTMHTLQWQNRCLDIVIVVINILFCNWPKYKLFKGL